MHKKLTVKDFLDIKQSMSPSISPDGSSVAYLSNPSGTYQLHLFSFTDNTSRQVSSYDDYISNLSFSPKENKILFSKAEGGNEKHQLFIYNCDTETTEDLTKKPDFMHRFGTWSGDGKKIAYASNERNGTDFDVYVMDLETGKHECVFKQGGWCDALKFDSSDRFLIIRKQHTFLHHDLFLVDLNTGKQEYLTPHKDKAEYGRPYWLASGKGFFYTSNEDRDIIGLSYFDNHNKESKNILDTQWDISDIALSKDGQYLAVVTNEEGYSVVKVYKIEDTNNAVKLIEIPDINIPKGDIPEVSWSSDGRRLVFSFGDSVKNPDIYLWTRESHEIKQLTQTPHAVPNGVFVNPELVSYESFDGLKIPMFLYFPKESNKKLPTVVLIHGGPEGQYTPIFAGLVQYIVHCGYVLAAPNVRGSSGYGKKYLALDDREKRKGSIDDLKYLHDFLKQDERIDENRVALMGGSYGGYMTLAGLVFYPDLWKVGIDTVGMSNLVSFLENTSSWRRALREAEYGYLDKDRELLESISPINFIENMKASLFVIHGANDPRVPLSEAEQIVDTLRKMKRDVELLVYSDEGHGLKKLKNRLDAYSQAVDFLDRHLKK